ncbi:uncharacterized protein EI90DRAFT_184015 [Cantharellus anzutake]|uniref:uncharacterized protein n=1 Tax=Cantharellus anzutake TaxID=1750568 RepID=UPI001902CE14|nr:uncharacterized protein EI90DRAFT_184015 [Cantharellus anzutake]KAF8336518.1 hypothetical protein EI90DRAFT_184015 [Cantharellus anzutake]
MPLLIRACLRLLLIPSLVSPKGFAILFDYAITALNELVQVSWKIRFGTPPEIALQVPSLHRKLERHNPDGLYSLLLEYFHLPALEAYPVVESFTAELKHHAHYPPPVLLSSVLRRLGDAVVLEVLLNAEMAEDTVTLLNRGDNPTEETEQALMKFKNDLDTRTRQIPRATESDWERATDVRSTDQSASEIGRKRALGKNQD